MTCPPSREEYRPAHLAAALQAATLSGWLSKIDASIKEQLLPLLRSPEPFVEVHYVTRCAMHHVMCCVMPCVMRCVMHCVMRCVMR